MTRFVVVAGRRERVYECGTCGATPATWVPDYGYCCEACRDALVAAVEREGGTHGDGTETH